MKGNIMAKTTKRARIARLVDYYFACVNKGSLGPDEAEQMLSECLKRQRVAWRISLLDHHDAILDFEAQVYELFQSISQKMGNPVGVL